MNMESIDQYIQTAVEPYIQMIEQLQTKQKEKEAEIVVLKYAMLEMDRKFQDLEKKCKPAQATGVAGRTTGRTTVAKGSVAASKTGTTTNTPRNNSKAPAQPDPRQRSRTPVASKMQNSLNNSMQSQTKVAPSKGLAASKTRVESKSRNQDLQSQSLKQATSSTRSSKAEEAKKAHPNTVKNASNRPSLGFKETGSRTSSRQGRDSSASAPGLRRTIQATAKDKQGDSSINNGRTRSSNKDSLHNEPQDPNCVSATFGKIQANVYSWESKPKRDDPSIKPNVELKLAYVPSYNGKSGRNNIEFIDKSHIAFYSSTVAIIMNLNTYEQSLLQGHSDEIQCMNYNQQLSLLCTAQKTNHKEKDPYFAIWDSQTQDQKAQVFYHQKAITQVAFNRSGDYLITIGGVDKVSVAIWKVQDLLQSAKKGSKSQQQPICEHQLGKIVINTLYVQQEQQDHDTLHLWMGAEKGVKLLTVKFNSNSISERKIALTSSESLKNIYDIVFQGEQTLALGDNGQVYTIRDDKAVENRLKTDGALFQALGIIERNNQSFLITFTEEGKVQFWEDGQDLIESFELYDEDIKSKLGTENIKLKIKSFNYNDGMLVIGFEQNIIIKFNLDTYAREVLISGPSNSTQFIAPHPKQKVFATVGLDKYLRIYSYDSIHEKKNCLINTIELQNQAKSCDFSPNGKFFAVGYENGVFEVFQVYDNDGEYFQLECLKLFDLNRKYPIQCVKFSPDNKFLIISCYKDLVVFNAQSEDFDQEGLLKGNTQTVLFLQFDKTSQYAMTNSSDGQILCWELTPGSFTRVDPSKVKDIEWDRKNCIYAWDTIGIWNPDLRETDVNCVSISNDKKLIAVADTMNRVRVFCYPAYLPRQNCLSLDTGHASHVISAQFMPDDSYLVTSGEGDNTIMIWAYKAAGITQESPLNLSLGNGKALRDADINDDLEREAMSKKTTQKQTPKNDDEDENLLEE